MKVDVLLGLQWGDEGKGKIVDVLSEKYDVVARFQGGANAGHTLEINGKKHILHIIPSGIFREDTINLIGNGVIIDPFILDKEIKALNEKNVDPRKNLMISRKAHIILPTHRFLDAVYEKAKGKSKIGSTLKGIGPTYTDKTARRGIRIGEIFNADFIKKYNALKEHHFRIIESFNCETTDFKIDGLSFEDYETKWFEAIEKIKEIKQVDGEYFINKCLNDEKSVLAEGAQGTLLDVDFGSYPFVTSSNTISSGVCSGLGVAPNKIGKIYGIVKAYCTRVGAGPFPTELFDETGKILRDIGKEYGSTTGRERRCGWLDMIALKYSIMLDGVTDLVMTKADVLDTFDTIKVCNKYNYNGEIIDFFPFEIDNNLLEPIYSDVKGWKHDISKIKSFDKLPQAVLDYIKYIETQTKVPITVLSTGPDREQTMIRE